MFHIFIFISFLILTNAENSCQKLAVCAIDKCIPPSTKFPPENEIIPELLNKSNFGCVLGPICYENCADCETCQYAQDQMKRLILREKTVGRCPLLEKCAKSCLDDQVKDPFSCVFKERCVRYCLDNKDCPQCFDIVKRVFTGYCYRAGFIEHYGQKCRVMFDRLVFDFVQKISS